MGLIHQKLHRCRQLYRRLDKVARHFQGNATQELHPNQYFPFFYSVKKLKSLDIPDSIESVKSKKLPKEVLKPIIPRFKLENDQLELIDTK
jgi:hypothetical protein